MGDVLMGEVLMGEVPKGKAWHTHTTSPLL